MSVGKWRGHPDGGDDSNSALANVRAFQSGVPRSLYDTTPSEARILLRACGLNDQSLAESRRAAANAAAGAGFGDAESNAETDKAAQDFVEAIYRSQGWRVTPVNLQRGLGYDIKAKKGKLVRHIEVKGVGGSEPSFFITRREVEECESDPHWCLAVVTNALSASKTIREWTAVEFLHEFDLTVVNFRASPLPER